jgi:hypothetical protein
MRSHPFLRAYMAGIVTPTLFLLLIMSADALHRAFGDPWSALSVQLPPIERAALFPMAVVPNLWGVWNMAFLAVHRRYSGWPIGLHGTVLVLAIMPSGVLLVRALGIGEIPWAAILPVIPFAMATYYLLWKFIVGFLNREMGIA